MKFYLEYAESGICGARYGARRRRNRRGTQRTEREPLMKFVCQPPSLPRNLFIESR